MMRELALFAGAGGGILGGQLLGWRTVCAVEIDPYARSVLLARQNDGSLSSFPIWDDITTFDGIPWRGCVDVVSGGFPCQDISVAGTGAGIEGERSGLWSEFARVIGEVRPRFVFVENSPALVARGIGRILGDLATLGYDARWGVLGADDAGAPHIRKRIWIVANANDSGQQPSERQRGGGQCTEARNDVRRRRSIVSDTSSEGLPESECETVLGAGWRHEGRTVTERSWWAVEPDVGRVAHGVANRVDRLRSIGNGQVPAVAAMAWRILSEQEN